MNFVFAHGHQEGNEHPTYAPNWSMVHFFYVFRKSGNNVIWLQTVKYKFYCTVHFDDTCVMCVEIHSSL